MHFRSTSGPSDERILSLCRSWTADGRGFTGSEVVCAFVSLVCVCVFVCVCACVCLCGWVLCVCECIHTRAHDVHAHTHEACKSLVGPGDA